MALLALSIARVADPDGTNHSNVPGDVNGRDDMPIERNGTHLSKSFAPSNAIGHVDPPWKLNGTSDSETFAPSYDNGWDPPMKLNVDVRPKGCFDFGGSAAHLNPYPGVPSNPGWDDPPTKLNSTNVSKTFGASNVNGHSYSPMKRNGTNQSKSFAPYEDSELVAQFLREGREYFASRDAASMRVAQFVREGREYFASSNC